jgi:hypothetical protein
VRDYEVRTRDRRTGAFKGWAKIVDLPTHALYWLRNCDWGLPAPETVSRNDATAEAIRDRVEVEILARVREGRL